MAKNSTIEINYCLNAIQIVAGQYLFYWICQNIRLLQTEQCYVYHQGVDVEDARQIPLKKYIEGCINGEEDHDINQYAGSH